MTYYNDNDSCVAFRNLGLTGLMLLSFLFAAFTNWFIGADGDTDSADSEYTLSIMPSDWIFETMWSINYGMQFIWMLYLMILTIRFASRESLFHASFYIFFIIANLANASLMYFWSNSYGNNTHNLLYTSLSCIIIDISLYIILFQSMRSLLSPVSSGQLPDWVTTTIKKLLIIFCVNGVAFYLGWVTFTCNLDFALALKWYWGASDEASSFVALSMLLLFMLIYTVLNYVWLDGYLSSIYTIYPALIVALTGVITEQGINNSPAIMACVLLGMNWAMFVAKIVINCIKAKKRSENYGILDYGYDMTSI